jgi:DNA-binding MarR family transcriptional regulator
MAEEARDMDTERSAVWWALEAAADGARRSAAAALRECGLTLAQYQLLEVLEGMRCGCCGEGECRCASSYLCQNDVGGRISCTKGNVSGLVQRLVAEGLISREPDPGDRRYNSVRVTVKGRAALMAARPHFAAAVESATRALTNEDLPALHTLLKKIGGHPAAAGRSGQGGEDDGDNQA